MPRRTIAATELANLLRQISHPNRIRLTHALRVGGHVVSEKAAKRDMTTTRLPQHRAVLRLQGLVEVETCGRSRRYRLSQPELESWLINGVEFIVNRISHADLV